MARIRRAPGRRSGVLGVVLALVLFPAGVMTSASGAEPLPKAAPEPGGDVNQLGEAPEGPGAVGVGAMAEVGPGIGRPMGSGDGVGATTELGRGIGRPLGIGVGPEGDVWVASPYTDSIARIAGDGTTTFTQDLRLSIPLRPVPGPLDSMWVIESGSRVTRIDGHTGETVDRYGDGYDNLVNPAALTRGLGNTMWFSVSGRIGRIDLDLPLNAPNSQTTFFSDPRLSTSSAQDMVLAPDDRIWFVVPDLHLVGAISSGGALQTVLDTASGIDSPMGITVGADGNLWVTDTGTSSIIRVSPSGDVLDRFAVPGGGKPYFIAAGTDGNLWFTLPLSNSVGRINTSGDVTLFTDPTMARPLYITAAPEGSVWFTNDNGESAGRISSSGVVTEFRGTGISNWNNEYQSDLTLGPDGAMWFTNGTNNSIGRVDTAGTFANFRGPGISNPQSIVSGPDGSLWFTNGGNGSIGRITVEGVVSNFPAPGSGSPTGITLGPDGNLWFTSRGSNSIGRMTPTGVYTRFTDPTINTPTGITLGPDGNLWFTNRVEQGSIGRITPNGVVTNFTQTEDPRYPIVFPMGISTSGNGTVWFTNAGKQWVGELTPAGVFIPHPIIKDTQPWGIAPGPDRRMWISHNQWGSGVSWIQMDGIAAPYAYGIPGAKYPRGIAAGPDSKMYYSASGRIISVELTGTEPNTPDSPMGVFATPADGEARVTWLPPRSDGGSMVTGYTVTASPGGATCSTSTVRSCVITGLTNGTAYTFTVVATNTNGAGPVSAPSNPVTPAAPTGVPGAPSSVSGQVSGTSVQLSWHPPVSDGGSPITAYQAVASPGGATCSTLGSNVCTFTGLPAGVAYTFTVRASNALGTGPSSAPSSALTPLAPPGPPTGVTGEGRNGSIVVSWVAPAFNGGAAITKYTVTASPGGASCTAWSSETSCNVGGLTNTQQYTFTVKATNSEGEGPASDPSAPVYAAGVVTAPGGWSATPGNGQVSFTWSLPSSDGGAPILGYSVVASPSGKSCETVGAESRACAVTGLTNGTAYTFTLRGYNIGGPGAPTVMGPFTPKGTGPTIYPPGTPTGVSGVAGDGQVAVSWSAPAYTGGSPINGYVVTAAPGGATCSTTGLTTCVVPGLSNGTAYTFTVRASNLAGTGPASAPSQPVTPLGHPSGNDGVWFHPMPPARILDSRPSGPWGTNTGGFSTPWGANTQRDVKVAGVGGVPANASAVVLNVTVTNASAASFLSVWPAGQVKPAPLVSSMNWSAGQTLANAVTAKVGEDGKVTVFNPGGNVDVIIDVVGWYDASPGDGFTSVAPARILDSRPSGPWGTNTGGFSTPWGANTQRDVKVAGVGGVPANASAVVLNVTVTNASAASFLSVWPAGQVKPAPLVSSMNWSAGQTLANAVTAKVGADGKVTVFNPGGNVDVIIDVAGYFETGDGDAFHALNPSRVLDSRPSGPGGPNVGAYATPWGPGTTRPVEIAGWGGVPHSGATAVLMNVTVTSTTAASFLSVWPGGAAQPVPLVSSMNWSAGQTRANSVTAALGGGDTTVFNLSGQVHVIADVAGWYG